MTAPDLTSEKRAAWRMDAVQGNGPKNWVPRVLVLLDALDKAEQDLLDERNGRSWDRAEEWKKNCFHQMELKKAAEAALADLRGKVEALAKRADATRSYTESPDYDTGYVSGWESAADEMREMLGEARS